MRIKKTGFLIKRLSFLILAAFPLLAFGVTQKEMEQARAIAAKSYIRYVNDGSGYLDEIHPKTIDELQAALKPKEKENIKVFLAIPMPTDYQSWDKQQLIDYWAGTVFKDSRLVEKGRGGRILTRKELNKMTVAAPQPVSSTPASDAANPAPSTPSEQEAQPLSPQPAAPSDTLETATQQLDDDLLYADADDLDFPETSDYTWVYIAVLAILVAIVIALIVYAANVMKKNAAASNHNPQAHEEDDESHAEEKYQAALADKDFEISMLTKKLENANKQNSELKTKLEALTSEIGSLRAAHPAKDKDQEAVSTPKAAPLRTIYLGRANARQIFVRADRTLNVGNSVFVLDTTDGVTGSFRVADSPAAWSLALSNPEEYLKNACTGHDLDDTNGASSIVNESSGTAMFEGGCWKVIRKAKIRYE